MFPWPGRATLAGMKVEGGLFLILPVMTVALVASIQDCSFNYSFPLFILQYMVIFYNAEVTI